MRIPMPCYIYVDKLFMELVKVVGEHECDCIALSGGIDTTVVLLAALEARLKPRGYTAMYSFGLPKDLVYVNYISKVFSVDVEFVQINSDVVEDLKSNVIRCIGVNKVDSHKDGGCVEVRNDIVFYATLEKARNSGCRCVYVGSGGDELFVGYGFMLNLSKEGLEEAIRRLARGRYPELEIAKCLGVEVVAPFLDNSIIELAEKIPIECMRSEKMQGKEILREILIKKGLYPIGERAKTPAESGAGTITICRSVYDE